MSSSKPLQPNNTHHHHNPHPTSAAQNGGAGECFGGSPPSPSPAPSLHRKFRRSLLVRSKSRRDASIAGALLRQCLRWFLLLVPLLYFFVVITCARPFPSIILDLLHPPAPGSVYRSLQIFDKLRDDICSDNSTPIELSSVWKYRRRRLRDQKPCIPPKITNTIGQHLSSIAPSRFLIVEVNGGLNQQRSAICNAVAVAGILNATLVIPRFEFHSIWMDKSTFGDIYDEDHFIATLGDYVRVVRELPEALMESYDYNISNIPNFRVMAWSSADYYLEEVYPVLQMHGIVRIAPFANRLAMFAPPHIQFLRCLANYEALKFSNPISTLAEKLVNRMIEKSSRTGGKYVSVHLRFEEDMVAFSCCVYDGSEAERSEMDLIRERGWRGKFKRKDQVIRPGLNRISGKCPLTPVEVGMMLRGMGFDNTTSIYLASGKIYKAEQHLAPLLKMFPLLYTKESLATTDELAIFEGYSSRLAALDYTVCLFSEVFMTTQGGNFPQFLMGHRRFLHGGHAKTIKPDKHKLVLLLQDMGISWRNFKDQMEAMLIESDLEGAIIPRKRKSRNKISLYAYPFPECKCLWESKNSTLLNHNNIHMHDQKKNVLR